MNDLTDELESDYEWTDARTLNTKLGVRHFSEMIGPVPPEFWKLWRSAKEELKDMGVGVTKDEDTDEFRVEWWRHEGTSAAPRIITPKQKIVPGIKVQNVVEDDGKATLEEFLYNKLHVGQRKMVMTHRAVFDAGWNFSLDASRMGEGKTYIALAFARMLGWNFGVVCPATLISKWTDTCIDAFDLEPEFIHSWEKLRLGNCTTREGHPYVTRINLHRGATFRWKVYDNFLVIFDELQNATGEGSLNSMLFDAALSNEKIFSLGLSGTVVDDPSKMRVFGKAVGLHQGHDFVSWAQDNGCRFNFWNKLEFTKNKKSAYTLLGNIHAHIFPEHGGRLLGNEAGTTVRPPHEIFVTPVDAPTKLPESLEPFLNEVKQARKSDLESASTRAERRLHRKLEEDEEVEVSGGVQAIRDRQRAELLLVPYVAEQTIEAIAEGKSVPIFCSHDSTLHALHSLLPESIFYNGSMSKTEKDDALRMFQSDSHKNILLNIASGSVGIDLHDLSGIHPRHSFIFPTFKAKSLLQAIGRTDRDGKKSKSTVELVFLSTGLHRGIMTAVQHKLDNLSLLHDGDLTSLQIKS